jgi:response regulator of citrate/malate metabolism
VIRTLVVDDDFRVARAHAASVDRVEGFATVGQAHSCEQARERVIELQPDLLLLDLYLPDGHGLDLVRSLVELPLRPRPDFVVITAARDVESVRDAMQLGAMYYLVKPFGFTQLSEQLTAYRRLHEGLDEVEVANQQTVDALYGLLRGPLTRTADRRRMPPTMARVFEAVRTADGEVSASDVADRLGISRATAQRYLADMVRRGLIDLDLSYGAPGRPEHRYRVRLKD